MSFVKIASLALACGACLASPAMSQSAPGQDWSTGWGFQSAADRSVGIARAGAIRQAETTPDPTTVINSTTSTFVNTTNSADNRSNYVDVTSGGQVTTDFQIGDEIGQNTNAIGSMNTGNTTIDITGDSNAITAVNSADNTGCIDGSALTSTMTGLAATGTLGLGSMAGGGFASATVPGSDGPSGSSIIFPSSDCLR